MPDLATALNIISTFALVGALVFTGLQVRTADRLRAEQAALAIIHTFQTKEWTRTLSILSKLPAGASPAQIDGLGPEVSDAIEAYGIWLETVGYMVFRGFVGIETVDQLFGGITVILWSRIKPWAQRDRERKSNPKMYEWVEWLADRLEERHSIGSNTAPAFVRYAKWKQSDARPAR